MAKPLNSERWQEIDQRKIEGNRYLERQNPSTQNDGKKLSKEKLREISCLEPKIPQLINLGADFCQGAEGGVYVFLRIEVPE